MKRRLMPVLVSLGLVVMPACGWNLGPRQTRVPFFPDFRVYNEPQPPQQGLELWIEGDSLTPDAAGRVAAWPDMRGGANTLRAWTARDGTMMAGTIASTTLRTPIGLSRLVRGLRCATGPRCSYALSDGAGTPRRDVLTGRPYAILTVVRRAGSRGDNYVVMTDGVGCSPAGGIGCDGNTALHLGWSGDRTLRLGQYYNDVAREVPRFNEAEPALSIIVGTLNVDGKTVGILERLFAGHETAREMRPLERSGRLFVGGTPWVDANPVPDWRFEGEIFAVLIYWVEVPAAELLLAADYLRNRYGPR